MGLFGKRPPVAPGEAEVLLSAMVLAVASDGVLDQDELKGLMGLLYQFPAFAGKDLNSMINKTLQNIGKNGFEKTVETIAASGEKVAKKSFIAACECCAASGGIGREEQSLLEHMFTKLGLAEDFAKATILVMETKYAE